jgi:transketolase C-terminal domain/subunit
VHDVCQNDQPVLIAVDRSGLVGEDGTSHQGMFTLTAQRQLPNLVIASPKDEQELRSLLRTGLAQDRPFALHYPRDAGFGLAAVHPVVLSVGQGEMLREGRDLLFVGFGPIVARALEAATALEGEGWSVGVINARFAKPLDRQLILDASRGKRLVVTFEESVATGGFGSGVLELIEEARLADPTYRDVPVRIIGIPGNRFVDHGSVADLRHVLRLDAPGLAGQVRVNGQVADKPGRKVQTGDGVNLAAGDHAVPDSIIADIKQSIQKPGQLSYFQLNPIRKPTLERKIKQLRDAGVVLLVGTDSGIPMKFHSQSTWNELDVWVNRFGFDAMYTIRAATYWPSVAMGVDKDFGTISEGKYADIIAVKGDLLRHIDLLQRVDVVVKKGNRYK